MYRCACMPPSCAHCPYPRNVESNNYSYMSGTRFEEAATALMAVSHLPNNTFLVLATGGRTRGTKLITKELCKALLRPAVRVDCGCARGAHKVSRASRLLGFVSKTVCSFMSNTMNHRISERQLVRRHWDILGKRKFPHLVG